MAFGKKIKEMISEDDSNEETYFIRAISLSIFLM